MTKKKVKSPTGTSVELTEHGTSGKDPWGGSTYLRRYASWLGEFDPEAIGLKTLLKMRAHHAIALGLQVIAAPLINAEWDIECKDEEVKTFLKAAIDRIYLKMLLYSLPAIELGFAAFTKQWAAEIPSPTDNIEVWKNSSVLPVIIKNLKQLDPLTVSPIVENDEFKGISQKGTPIDRMYSVWMTHYRHKVWGNLWGWPLLTNAYKLWYSSSFRFGLRDRHIEDRVSPPVVVRFPPGWTEIPSTGDKVYHRDLALKIGQSIRSGETVALPSDYYGEEEGKSAGKPKWDVDYLTGGENVEAFTALDDADDVRIFMALLIPPGAVLQSSGGLGSQSIAETLGRLYWETQLIRKRELDQQFTDYIVQPMADLNFANAPRAKLVTRRFMRSDYDLMASILKIVANRQDLHLDSVFDIFEIGKIMNIPMGNAHKTITKPTIGEQASMLPPEVLDELREETF